LGHRFRVPGFCLALCGTYPSSTRGMPGRCPNRPQPSDSGAPRSLPSPAVRAPVDHIAAPAFPPGLPWVNVASLRIDQQLGRPVLLEFWDFCRPNSIRTLPYMKAWNERYERHGLRVIGVHASGFQPSSDPEAVRTAVERLEIPYPVVVDAELEIWQLYGNLGWPARYLFNQKGMLLHYHYGEGAYDETELAIQELLGLERPILAPIRPGDEPGALLAAQTEDLEGSYSGPYEAGGVWAVLDGDGEIRANGTTLAVEHPGCYQLIAHERSTAGVLNLELGEGVDCYAVCFTPGLAA
jgi:thiol-disulfide isomerase/thioredoxin